MPSFEITKLPSRAIDIAFNSYSLAEMSPSTSDEYLDHIARVVSGYFLHVNHNRASLVRADDFGIEARGSRLLNRELAGWTSGLNPESDEYEYLYQAV